MGCETLEFQMRRRSKGGAESGEIFRCCTQASHTCVQLEMDCLLRNSDPGSCPLQQFDVSGLPYSRSQAKPDDFLFFTAPEPGHQQNSRLNALFAKGNSFVERGHSQPGGAFLLKCFRALYSTVPVGVGFDHGADRYPTTHVVLDGAVILSKGRKRHFSPP